VAGEEEIIRDTEVEAKEAVDENGDGIVNGVELYQNPDDKG
jgi:hypothetical protein